MEKHAVKNKARLIIEEDRKPVRFQQPAIDHTAGSDEAVTKN